MKIKFRDSFALSLLGILILSGCDKEDNARINSNTSLITASPWKLISLAVNPGVDTDADGILENELVGSPWGSGCNDDNFEIFHTNNNLTYEEGGSKCLPNDPQIIASGNWSFINQETQLIKTWGWKNSPDTLNVISISKTDMVLQLNEVRHNVKSTYIFTYKN